MMTKFKRMLAAITYLSLCSGCNHDCPCVCDPEQIPRPAPAPTPAPAPVPEPAPEPEPVQAPDPAPKAEEATPVETDDTVNGELLPPPRRGADQP